MLGRDHRREAHAVSHPRARNTRPAPRISSVLETNHHPRSWASITWFSGSENSYRVGADGYFDLAPAAPWLVEGAKIVRGPDWKWKVGEDGGANTIAVPWV